MTQKVYDLIAAIRREFAPDPRIAVFEVDAVRDEGTLTFYGAVSDKSALEALRLGIAGLDPGLQIRDEIVRLPIEDAGFIPHAVVRSATAPLLAGPIISESHLSQLVLGSRVLVLREHGRWLQCQSVDGYVGWLHRGYVQRMTEPEVRAWEAGMNGVSHFSIGAELVTASGEVTARLPWGARFSLRGSVAILPDGREGLLRGLAVPLTELPRHFPLNGNAIAATAVEWTGAPYLWGGITPAGVDCSGLVQAVFRAHGVELPRDSDQQALVGDEVSAGGSFELLVPGDLLFFAESGDRVSHVAISRGGSSVVHSALGNGGVGCNDLRGKSGFERELRRLLQSVRRVVPC